MNYAEDASWTAWTTEQFEAAPWVIAFITCDSNSTSSSAMVDAFKSMADFGVGALVSSHIDLHSTIFIVPDLSHLCRSCTRTSELVAPSHLTSFNRLTWPSTSTST